ncbi:pirin family protein [Chitinophaga sp. SYP-B3965]|uniref:pirin family protein n=1 Tax=Chitinophaga sp. SYP-B3965 TaxID=2663120 RepID=UPI001299DECD|nr:pirin family protein [Chitinophaga sp. SYP-B3965]MRG43711.1 pirin family protein [Chitinophaga sp. SYP-B3965]
MHKYRSVRTVLYADLKETGDIPVRQPFPSAHADRIDPFLLLHHINIEVPTYIPPRHAGVAPHPHRGFSPVTFIFKGGVHHRDSRGNNSVVREGGTQWMHAGMGVIHSERPPEDIHETGGVQELLQLWVNSPASRKKDQPAYYPLHAADTPSLKTEDGRAVVHVVTGELLGTKGPIPTLTPVNTFTAHLKKGGQFYFPIPATHHAFIYLLDGELRVEGASVYTAFHAVVFNEDGEGFNLIAEEDTRVFIASGEPLNENIAQHGPYVMNTETEVLEAMRDFQMGKMGILIEE